jgi:hypothetical protein
VIDARVCLMVSIEPVEVDVQLIGLALDGVEIPGGSLVTLPKTEVPYLDDGIAAIAVGVFNRHARRVGIPMKVPHDQHPVRLTHPGMQRRGSRHHAHASPIRP